MGGVAEAVGGVADRVHILLSLRPTHCPSDFVRELKKASSVWAKQNLDDRFEWQEGCALFSAGFHEVEALRKYISNQAVHHGQIDYLAELRRLLDEAGVPYEDRFLV